LQISEIAGDEPRLEWLMRISNIAFYSNLRLENFNTVGSHTEVPNENVIYETGEMSRIASFPQFWVY